MIRNRIRFGVHLTSWVAAALLVVAALQANAANGVPLWIQREMASTTNLSDEAKAAARLVDGSIMVVSGMGDAGTAILRYDASGNLLSSVMLETTYWSWDYAITPFGDVVVSRMLRPDGDIDRVTIMKYDGYTGRPKWPQQYILGELAYRGYMTVGPTGDVYYATQGFAASTSVITVVKLNGGDGSLEWRRDMNISSSESAEAIRVAPSGDVIVMAIEWTISTVRNHLIALNPATGATRWSTPTIGSQQPFSGERLPAMTFDSTGAILVGGNGAGAPVLIKYTAGGAFSWSRSLSGASFQMDTPDALAVDMNNNIFITGSVNGSGFNNRDVLVAKVSATNAVLWNVTKNGPLTTNDTPAGIVVDRTGDVVVTGSFDGNYASTTANIGTLKIRGSDGSTAWSSYFNAGSTDFPAGLVLDDSGDVVVAGTSVRTGTVEDVQVNRLSSDTGNAVWQRTWSGLNAPNRIRFSGADASGNIIVVTRPFRSGVVMPEQYQISKYDGVTGARTWMALYTPAWSEYFNTIAVAPNGNFALIGTTSSGGRAVVVDEFDGTTGSLRWRTLYQNTLNTSWWISADAASYGPDGNLVVAGVAHTSLFGGPYKIDVLKLSSIDGQVLWRRNDFSLDGADVKRLMIDTTGRVAVVGSYRPVNDWRAYFAIQLDTNSTQLWVYQSATVERIPDTSGPYYDGAIDAAGNVFITGADMTATGGMITRKLDTATGGVLWTARYTSTGAGGKDFPRAISIDGSGNVVVAGRTPSPTGSSRVVVEKYAAADGATLWTRFADGAPGLADLANVVATAANGDVFVTGAAYTRDTDGDAFTLRYAADGTELWTASTFADGYAHEYDTAMHLVAGLPVVVTGSTLARLGETLGIITQTLPRAGCGVAYDQTLAATNGVPPYTWSATSLPAFLALNPGSGQLTGTAPGEGSWTFDVTVQDSVGTFVQRTFRLDSVSVADAVPIIAANNPACTSTQLSVAGTWTSYLWSTGETTATIVAPVNHQALYGVTLSNGGCLTRGFVTLRGMKPLSSVTITPSGSMTACPTGTGGSVSSSVADGGTPSYQWAYRTVSGGPATNIAGQTSSSYTLNGAHFPGVGSYYLVLRVTPWCGAPTDSNEVSVTIADLPSPTGVTATATAPRTITVSWTAASAPGLDHYNVYRAPRACPGVSYTYIGQSFGTTYTDSLLTPGVDYSYVVRSANAGSTCTSADSNCDDATAYGDCTIPPSFTSGVGLTATPRSCVTRLSWNAAQAACPSAPGIVYSVYRGTTGTFTPAAANRIARCVANTFYEDLNPPAGTSHYIVHAEDSSTGGSGACNGGNEDGNTVRVSANLSAGGFATPFYSDNFDTARPANAAAYWKEIYIRPTTAPVDYISLSSCQTSGGSGQSYYFGTVGSACNGQYVNSLSQKLELGGDGSIDPLVNGITLPSLPAGGSIRLRFKQWFYTEANWDGVSLTYRTNTTSEAQVGDTFSATAPYISQGWYSATNTVVDPVTSARRKGWTGDGRSFAEVVVNLDALAGRKVWLTWWFTTDSAVFSGYNGHYVDDVTLETFTPQACDITGPLQAFTVTSRDGINKLEWLNPASTYYASTLIRYRTDGVYPTSSTDGLPLGTGVFTGTADTYASAEHVVGTGTPYRYSAWPQSTNGLIGPGRVAKGRPEPIAATKWIYNTGATAMTPPGIASIFAVSNDRILHSIQQGTSGGDWAPGWRPFAMNGPSQARPSVVSMNNNRINGAPKVAFIGSQDGYVYAVNAATGAELWGTQIGQMVQTAPSVALREYGIGLMNVDLIIAGTRNSAPPNGIFALNTQGGATAWSYTGGGTYTIGVIGGQVSLDYATRRVYFASRAASASTDQNHTLWCLSFNDNSVTRVWSVPLGDIDGSPVLRNGTLYVGTNNGTVHAVNPNDGTILASFATNDGPVKSFPFPNSDGRIYFSTTNRVWSLTDNLSAPRSLSLNWSVSSIPAPSTTVLARNALYVGSSDGRLYRLSQLTDPAPTIAFAQLGNGLAAVGTIGYDFQNDLAYVGTAEGAIYAVSIP